ncbi:MAG TPA: GntR family transcriptional regulator [Nocardioidaceae bacterium]|nr:GntR family transcriptional regulator [Nocardioidaceae bacterium]
MTTEGLKPVQLRVSSIVDAVEQSLREQILDQDIPSGSPVRETEVARVFNIARPTAKAAIERLVAAGLLRRDAHKSARVPTLSSEDVSDLYSTRILLESAICRSLAKQRNLPATAMASIEELRAVPEDAPPRQFVEPDIAFHSDLTRQAGGTRLTRIHGSLMQEMRLCMAQVQAHRLIPPDIIVAEHQEIADAIAAGDGAAAAHVLCSHLVRARTALLAYLESVKTPSTSSGNFDPRD